MSRAKTEKEERKRVEDLNKSVPARLFQVLGKRQRKRSRHETELVVAGLFKVLGQRQRKKRERESRYETN